MARNQKYNVLFDMLGKENKRKQRNNALGEALRTARENAGMAQLALSYSMGYDYNVVSSWENGSKPFHEEEWPRLCVLVTGLDPALASQHQGELSLGEGRKLKPRPSRLDARVTEALNRIVAIKAPGIAGTELARAIGMDYVAFWKLLKGKANPTIGQLHLLADYFDVDTDALLGRRILDNLSYAQAVSMLNQLKTKIQALEEEIAYVRQLNDILLAEKE